MHPAGHDYTPRMKGPLKWDFISGRPPLMPALVVRHFTIPLFDGCAHRLTRVIMTYKASICAEAPNSKAANGPIKLPIKLRKMR